MSPPRPRPWWSKLALGLATALLALLALELLLAGVTLLGERDWRVDPLPEAADYPVVCPKGQQLAVLCPEAHLGYERVRPEMFFLRADRPRVVAIGESFVFGLRLPVEQAWPARLEEQLGGRAEVLNWGRCGSYAGKLVPAVRAAIDLQPDLLVLAVGNNEHTMTSFYSGWFGRRPGLAYGLTELLSRSRLFGLLAHLVGGVPEVHEVQKLERSFDDELDRAVYSARRRPPDLSLFEDGLANREVTQVLEREQRLKERIFRRRLLQLVDEAQQVGIPVVLATLPRDLSTPPVLSGVQRGDPDTVRRLVRQLAADDRDDPAALVAAGLAADDRVAIFQYARGRLLLAQGEDARAAEAFRAAAEWDLVPDSTPGLNQVVRQVARERGCPLVDLALLSDEHMRRPGAFFLDRVHVNQQGAQRVAAELAAVVEPLLGSAR